MLSTYREYPPPRELAPFVECAWSGGGAWEAEAHVILPDGCADIVHAPRLGLVFTGTMTRPIHSTLEPGDLYCGIRFHAGGAKALLGDALPLPETVDRTIQLEDLFGREARRLSERLGDSPVPVETLFAALRGRKAEQTGLRQALRFMERAHGAVDLDRIAFEAGLSSRQFRRRCIQETGLAPKQLCRILRFRRAHLIRDFQEFAGQSPAAFRHQRR
jgi:hypothetical protein